MFWYFFKKVHIKVWLEKPQSHKLVKFFVLRSIEADNYCFFLNKLGHEIIRANEINKSTTISLISR